MSVTWTDKLRTGTGLLTHTPLIGIRQHAPSNAACSIDLRRAQQAENMRRGTSAPRAPSTSGTQSGREPARPLHARTPDLRANHTRGSRYPRRYAPCSWTRRCARALSCDRGSTPTNPTNANFIPLCNGREEPQRENEIFSRLPFLERRHK